jgi:hypothetical protein
MSWTDELSVRTEQLQHIDIRLLVEHLRTVSPRFTFLVICACIYATYSFLVKLRSSWSWLHGPDSCLVLVCGPPEPEIEPVMPILPISFAVLLAVLVGHIFIWWSELLKIFYFKLNHFRSGRWVYIVDIDWVTYWCVDNSRSWENTEVQLWTLYLKSVVLNIEKYINNKYLQSLACQSHG